jgi:hypothetical protein
MDVHAHYALANRHEDVHMLLLFQCVGGFGGWRMQISSDEDKAAFARARAIRDVGLATLKKQGSR